MSEREQRRWWSTGYGKITALLGVVGVLFTLAQLPVQLAGFPQTIKSSVNVVQDLFASKSTVVSATSIGSHDIHSLGMSEAIAAFGPPESKTGARGVCTLRWESQGIVILFAATTGATCRPDQSFFCSATLTTHRWRTQQGLHVGDSLRRLRSIYPDVPRTGPAGIEQTWILDQGELPCPFADPSPAAGLRAVTIGDYVDHLEIDYFGVME